MSALDDTSVLIDYLRGHDGGRGSRGRRAASPLHASEITRLEVLARMRANEEGATGSLLSTLIWHPLDAEVAEEAGALGRRWPPSHHLGGADLAIAATALRSEARLLACNVRHFPMFAGLRAPY